MGHDHSHAHGHQHNHGADLSGRNLLISIGLNILITLAQAIGGIISGSLSLLSDAAHNLSDVLSLIVSYIARVLSKKEASLDKTFGYKRAEILAAFINAATLLVVALLLIKEAVVRYLNPEPIESSIVIWMAALGIVANGFSVLLIKKDSDSNMNMKSAYLHLLTDMMASVAVLVGGILMSVYKVYWIDPLLTFAISIYLIVMGYGLLKSSFKVLMLFSPDDIELSPFVNRVKQIKQVKNIHHMHIWQLNEKQTHLEAHIDLEADITMSEFDTILDQIEAYARECGINHVNIQPEFDKTDDKKLIVQH
ncbi:cation diffusion facilitator family transporter [Leeuwenhoekiella nanhaiensis]|uniref:Cation transporter n=1 Tax=Leeuwenhoekiella nanhaiensis TaxID=1655491 RepID=A0A2G1VVI7_9FLAO|nr:cation diffusion facilitator family transporter [Leeuwenhoekiella nanhaiensis]PHQ30731.1 cation transporter [Leeuwenhoekiella nanhaiensis]